MASSLENAIRRHLDKTYPPHFATELAESGVSWVVDGLVLAYAEFVRRIENVTATAPDSFEALIDRLDRQSWFGTDADFFVALQMDFVEGEEVSSVLTLCVAIVERHPTEIGRRVAAGIIQALAWSRGEDLIAALPQGLPAGSPLIDVVAMVDPLFLDDAVREWLRWHPR